MKQLHIWFGIWGLFLVFGVACSLLKHDVKCPSNAYCEALDFGAAQLTVCVSPSDPAGKAELESLRRVATQRRALYVEKTLDAGPKD